MFKKLLFALVIVSLLVGSIVYIKMDQFAVMTEAAENMQMPPTTVTASKLENSQWEQVIKATASVSPVQGVTVSAETAGRVTEILFDSADLVNEGQVLLQLDTTTEQSQLASAQAAAEQAVIDLKRQRQLIKKKLASADTVDQAETRVKQTRAQVGVIQATIKKKTIKAPFSGRLGLRQVNLGQVLSIGDPVVVLQMLNPVYIDFSIPQQKLSLLQQNMQVRVKSDATSDETFTGKISAINLEVDPVTRNVQVRALVDNPDEQLRSGMFVNVELVLPDKLAVLPVPATAVLYAPFGNSVFVIDEKNSEDGEVQKVLRQQFITLGKTMGDFVQVTDGLKAGESVVTSGVFKLYTGMQVVIDNTLEPKPSLDPQPNDS